MFTLASLERREGTERQLQAIIAVAAAALLFLGLWLAYESGRSVRTELALAERTHAAQQAAEAVLSSLRDMEAGQRHYLLTDSPADLASYRAAREQFEGNLTSVANVLASAREWTTTLQRIRSLALDKEAVLIRAIDLHRSGKTDAARDMALADDGNRLTEAIAGEVGTLHDTATARMALASGHQADALTVPAR